MNLVRAAMKTGFEAFVNTGSSSEYGFKNHPPAETTFLEPNSHYAVTKAAATMFCSFTARHHKVHIPTLRLYSIYGPFEDPNRLFPQLLVQGLKGQFPPLANPDIARDFVYIDDAVAAYLKAATVTGQEHGAVYNVGSGVQTTLRQVAEVARECLQIPIEPNWGSMPAREWDSTCWISEPSLIRRQLGWIPRFDLKAGFRAFTQWLRDNPRWLKIYEQATQK
jgi:dolichol-phosphate mannosyltransferase